MEEENKKEIKYPILILDLKGNYRIYADEHTYFKFDNHPDSQDKIKKVIKSAAKDRIYTINTFDDSRL